MKNYYLLIPDIKISQKHKKAKYTEYPNMHTEKSHPSLKFSILARTAGGYLPDDDHRSLLMIIGSKVEIEAWAITNQKYLTLLSRSEAQAIGKELHPEYMLDCVYCNGTGKLISHEFVLPD